MNPIRAMPFSTPRRDFLRQTGGGFGALALAGLLQQEGLRGGEVARPVPATGRFGGLLHKTSGLHHAPKAQRVIQLFMNGGASPMDTFDYKPRLAQLHGQAFDPGKDQKVESVTGSPGFKVLKSPFAFKQYGNSGRWVSQVFPHLSGCVDQMAFLMSMVSKTNVHGPASYLQNTGFMLPGFPSMGSWISYGLGTLNDNLPTFVILPDHRGLPYNNQGNFTSGFLPVLHQGTIIKARPGESIPYLHPPKDAGEVTAQSQTQGREVLDRLNRLHAQDRPGDSRLESRIAGYELAARLQLAAPGVLDLSDESPWVRQLYGLDRDPTRHFAHQCILARRLVQSGVRFVQVWSGTGGPTLNWDNHGDIVGELTPIAAQTDQPIAALLADLKARGMLEDTLVVWTTEFGRMPFSQGQAGRDHNGGTFVSWLAGAGIQEGVAHGQSDEWGWKALEPVTVHDLHATILHLMGIDHEKLTVRHNSIDRRLTDVHGDVIREILA